MTDRHERTERGSTRPRKRHSVKYLLGCGVSSEIDCSQWLSGRVPSRLPRVAAISQSIQPANSEPVGSPMRSDVAVVGVSGHLVLLA